MAEKHKSKYKKPENKKPTYRKDIKDYTMDDKEGGMNPKTTGDAHLTTFRKTDKEMQDDGKMYPTYKDDDRLYKDLEDGEYDPKTAAKRLEKRQETEEKDLIDTIENKVKNLTKEQQEAVIREYIRRKIAKVLAEQATTNPDEEPATEEPAPVEEPAAEPTAPPATPETAPPAPEATPAPSAAPTPTAVDQLPPEEKNAIAIEKFVSHLQKETGNIARTKSIGKVLDAAMKDAEPEDARNFYKLILKMVAKKYRNIVDSPESNEQ